MQWIHLARAAAFATLAISSVPTCTKPQRCVVSRFGGLFVAVLLAFITASSTVASQPDLRLFNELSSEQRALSAKRLSATGQGPLETKVYSFNPAVAKILHETGAATVAIDLPGAGTVEVDLRLEQQYGEAEMMVSGSVRGFEVAPVYLSFFPTGIEGSLLLPGNDLGALRYVIARAQGGAQLVSLLHPSASNAAAVADTISMADKPMAKAATVKKVAASVQGWYDDGTRVDVLPVFSKSFQQATKMNGKDLAEYAQSQIRNQANLAFSNSGLGHLTIRVVGILPNGSLDPALVLSRSIEQGLGGVGTALFASMDPEIENLRNKYGADHVTVIVENFSGVECGGSIIASVFTPGVQQYNAIARVHVDSYGKHSCAGYPELWIHEFGHNLGGRHAIIDEAAAFPTLSAYSYGYSGNSIRTIMGTPASSMNPGILYFSKPNGTCENKGQLVQCGSYANQVTGAPETNMTRFVEERFPLLSQIQTAADCKMNAVQLHQKVNAEGASNYVIDAVPHPDHCWADVVVDAASAEWLTAKTVLPVGSGSIIVSATPNMGAARVGLIKIGSTTIRILQNGAACSYVITPDQVSPVPYTSSTQRLAVTSATGCTYRLSTTGSWLKILSPASPVNGSAIVQIAVDQNVAPTARSAQVTIEPVNGQPAVSKIITQSGIPCAPTLSISGKSEVAGIGSTPVPVTATTALSPTYAAGTVTINVESAAGCPWSAASSDPTWLTASKASGSGGGVVTLAWSRNQAVTSRAGYFTVAGVNIPIVQADQPCAAVPQVDVASLLAGEVPATGKTFIIPVLNRYEPGRCSWVAGADGWAGLADVYIEFKDKPGVWVQGQGGYGDGTIKLVVNLSPRPARQEHFFIVTTATPAGATGSTSVVQDFWFTQVASACQITTSLDGGYTFAGYPNSTAMQLTVPAGCPWSIDGRGLSASPSSGVGPASVSIGPNYYNTTGQRTYGVVYINNAFQFGWSQDPAP